HVAGTNGKGSTSSMIAAVLQASGYKTALYTSPHLVKFNERIRINGSMISDRDLTRYAQLFRPQIDSLNATFFEATTAIAFKYFADSGVDFAVIETGLGGRLDATNVLIPEVSIITSIAKDHTELLGTSFRKIAYEKGGIIKRERPCVVGTENKSALDELKRIARQRRSRFIPVEMKQVSDCTPMSNGGQRGRITTERRSYKNLIIPLPGIHQFKNAAMAISALECLDAKGLPLSESAIRKGLANVTRLTGLRGRFEILRHRPLVVVDVSHNPNGISSTIAAIQNHRYRKLLLLFGVMGDKDYRSMIRLLSALRPVVFAAQPMMTRALPSDRIMRLFRETKCTAHAYSDTRDAIADALKTLRREDALLICGSHYVAGEVLPLLDKRLRRKSS
ncbi:MAG TPA: folylpolyglutamate synthase/dihydrofolate synthase family protein, partial [Bacteroidota bacterium]|nr:folylpolyglutamate synthase/dihydrofolate synthase family protein [Bacteroidota bacterium]